MSPVHHFTEPPLGYLIRVHLACVKYFQTMHVCQENTYTPQHGRLPIESQQRLNKFLRLYDLSMT